MTPKKTNLGLGDFLREAREKADLTQKAVATQLGYGTAQFVSEWERGVRSPPGTALRKLVKLYRVPLKVFYEIILEEQTIALRMTLQKEIFGKISKK